MYVHAPALNEQTQTVSLHGSGRRQASMKSKDKVGNVHVNVYVSLHKSTKKEALI
jgi:hypothetical protein